MRQQQEIAELSTPVVKLWEGILALPLIGTLDSARTQVVMENLLQAIVDQSAEIAIIDITGVPTVDTLVAQHLLKTVAAARLMGADCIIVGHPAADRADHGASGRRAERRLQGHAGRCLRARAASGPGAPSCAGRHRAGGGAEPHGPHPDPEARSARCWSPSRSTCTTDWPWRSRTTSRNDRQHAARAAC